MGIVRVFRGIDDKAAKEGVNIVEQLRRRPNGYFLASSLSGLLGIGFSAEFFKRVGHEDLQQSEDASPARQRARAAARPSASQVVPSISDCRRHHSRSRIALDGKVMTLVFMT